MATGAGVCSQTGYKLETTVGTAVTVDRFHRHLSVGGAGLDPVRVVDEGLGGCVDVVQADRTVEVATHTSREVALNVTARSLGPILKLLLGSTAVATQLGVTAIWRQIHNNGEVGGKSATFQFGFPEASPIGTIRAITMRGCKITQWELSQRVNDLLKLSFTIDGWAETTATALATAAYVAGETYGFKQYSCKIGGTPTFTAGLWGIAGGTEVKGCRGGSIRGALGLRTDGYFSGGAGVKSEQLQSGHKGFTGDLDTEFADRTQLYDIFATYTTTAVQQTWTGADNDGGNFVKVDVVTPFTKLMAPGGNPMVDGPGILGGRTGFAVYGDPASLTNPAIQLVYDSRDTTL